METYARQSAGRVKAIPSLGFKRYLSAVAMASAVVGNSSSGIIEVRRLVYRLLISEHVRKADWQLNR